ncbi:hypothetical protein KJ628_04285 [Patescibacteria group bacterium]|nr:hypothetical protein [Patescibacteria group bacterium]
MQSKIDQLINEAEKFLTEKAFDATHGLEHHKKVWANVQKMTAGIEEQFDLIALHIAAMWHDVTTETKKVSKKRAKKKTAQYVTQKMADLGFPQSTINKTKTAILEHSIMNTQSILESKILADADLLEWFNIERFLKTLHIYSSGRGAKIKKIALSKFAKKWTKKIPDLIHFDITRKFYYQKLALFKKDVRIKKTVLEKYKKKIEEFI